jgi:hypothetical protein
MRKKNTAGVQLIKQTHTAQHSAETRTNLDLWSHQIDQTAGSCSSASSQRQPYATTTGRGGVASVACRRGNEQATLGECPATEAMKGKLGE